VSDEERAQVGVGSHVVVELIDERGGRETFEFDLVPENAADIGRGLLSVAAPLGKAVRGKRAGSEVDYRMGDIQRVRIISVGPAQQVADPDAAERRQEMLEEARRKAERTNADMFASSFSGKWGDYSTDDMDDDVDE
jgi:hypothetical protein